MIKKKVALFPQSPRGNCLKLFILLRIIFLYIIINRILEPFHAPERATNARGGLPRKKRSEQEKKRGAAPGDLQGADQRQVFGAESRDFELASGGEQQPAHYGKNLIFFFPMEKSVRGKHSPACSLRVRLSPILLAVLLRALIN